MLNYGATEVELGMKVVEVNLINELGLDIFSRRRAKVNIGQQLQGSLG